MTWDVIPVDLAQLPRIGMRVKVAIYWSKIKWDIIHASLHHLRCIPNSPHPPSPQYIQCWLEEATQSLFWWRARRQHWTEGGMGGLLSHWLRKNVSSNPLARGLFFRTNRSQDDSYVSQCEGCPQMIPAMLFESANASSKRSGHTRFDLRWPSGSQGFRPMGTSSVCNIHHEGARGACMALCNRGR